MVTVVKNSKGKIERFITQQYEVGLYVAVYKERDPIPDQFGVKIDEKEFHLKLRETIAKKRKKFTIIMEESTIIN
jgi:hypothetical protein